MCQRIANFFKVRESLLNFVFCLGKMKLSLNVREKAWEFFSFKYGGNKFLIVQAVLFIIEQKILA